MLKINRSSLKDTIKTETTCTHKLRAEAKLLFKEAGATTNYSLQRQAQAKKSAAELGRDARRSLTLAAAFLNNTAYSRCERNSSADGPSVGDITALVLEAIEQDHSLATEFWHKHVRQVIETWLSYSTLTRHDLMPDTVPERFRAPEAKAA